MFFPTNILVTGGAGFIGSNFVYLLARRPDFDGGIIVLDKLTYAGNAGNLAALLRGSEDRIELVRGDIADQKLVASLLQERSIDTIVHLAAESHVDRSIVGPGEFIQTNIVGTFSLLEAARATWGQRQDVRFHHLSTDEVYGSLGSSGKFSESSPYRPRSPYSASKAASDHLVRAYYHTYGLPVTMSNSSNNYGPFQFPEKLIPLMILRMTEGESLPVYGTGQNIRDWLYVEDHCRGVWSVLTHGEVGQSYNLGGGEEKANIDVVRALSSAVAARSGIPEEDIVSRIQYVADRAGHDFRYAVDSAKAKKELGWEPEMGFEKGIQRTVDWYLSHEEWVTQVRTGEYLQWVDLNYAERGRYSPS